MTEQPREAGNSTTSNNNDGQPAFASVEDALKEINALKERLSVVNDESAKRRHEVKRLNDELEALRVANQARLEEQGNFKELASQYQNKLANLEPVAQRAESLEAMIRESNQRRIDSVREDMRPLIPSDYAPEKLAAWLDANLSRLTAPIAPDLDGGRAGGGSKISLTDQERAIAAKFGLTPDEYAKGKERSNR